MPYEFVFKKPVDEGGNFVGSLEQFQCGHVNPVNNRECKRKGYMGFDRCWQHMRSDYHVRIKKSTIPNAGKGLFADCPEGETCFQAGAPSRTRGQPPTVGERILWYDGERINKQELDARYGENGTAPYGIQIANSNVYEDGALKRSIAAFANSPPPGVQPNAKLYYARRGNNLAASLGSIKRIKNGDEIFANYGTQYQMDSPYYTKYKPP